MNSSRTISRCRCCLYLLVLPLFSFSSASLADIQLSLEQKLSPQDEFSARILLLPKSKATLSSQLSSKLVRFPYQLGEYFKKNARLADFDCDVLDQELAKANAELEIVVAKHVSNEKMKQYQSISDLEIAISAAEVKKGKAEVGIVKARTRYCSIRAPYAGRVVKRHVNLSENVSKGQEVVDIISNGKPRVQMFVPSNWTAWLTENLKFTIKVDETGKSYSAKILRVVGQINPVSQTIEVEAIIDSKVEKLLPGMSGTAFFAERQ